MARPALLWSAWPCNNAAAEPADAAIPQSRGLEAESREAGEARGRSPGHADGRLLPGVLTGSSLCVYVSRPPPYEDTPVQ